MSQIKAISSNETIKKITLEELLYEYGFQINNMMMISTYLPPYKASIFTDYSQNLPTSIAGNN